MKLIVDDFSEDIRLDSYLAEYMHDVSRSKIQSEIKNGLVLVNGKSSKSAYKVNSGDIIEFNFEDKPIKIEPENIELNIVYDDDNIAVVNKPSGMLTHPTTIEQSGTLVNALLYRYKDNLSDINGEFRRGIVHRLDRNTSGLIMIAKNNKSHEYLAEKIKNREISKKYIAIVKGVIDEDEFIVDKPIGRNPNQPHKMCILEGGKESISKIKVLERFSDATLVEVLLVTGRTHQIRVHMASIGHPVFNDTLYGFGKMKVKTDEQVLESYKLTFPKPFDGEEISLEIEPDDKVKKVLNYLRG